MQLPSRLEDLFTQTYDGFRSVKLRSASEAIVVENALSRASMSYQTKITRSKKHGREFVILLVESIFSPNPACSQDCNQGRNCICAETANAA